MKINLPSLSNYEYPGFYSMHSSLFRIYPSLHSSHYSPETEHYLHPSLLQFL